MIPPVFAAAARQPRLPGYAPLRPGDPVSLRELGSTYLPFEREMRARWTHWQRAQRSTPMGDRVPSDLLALLRESPAPPGLARAFGTRRPIYRPQPLPGRPLEGPWIAFQDAEFRPREGRAYRIARPRRRTVVWRASARDAWHPEEVLLSEEPATPLSDAEFYPAPRPRPVGVEGPELARRFAEAVGLSPSLARSALLPLVGAPPWHGRPAGLDLVMGSPSIATSKVAPFAHVVRALLPPWEAPGRARRGTARPSPQEIPLGAAPYRVAIQPVGARGFERLLSKPVSTEQSTLLYGEVATDAVERTLFAAHLPVIEPPTRWIESEPFLPDPELSGLVADHLVRAHFTEPAGMEGDALHATLEVTLERVRAALLELPRQLGLPRDAYEQFLLRSLPLRDHLVQASFAFARYRGAAEVAPEDFRAVADRYVDSLAALASGSSRATRELLAWGTRIRSRHDRAKFFLLRSTLLEAGDLELDEIWARVKGSGRWKRRGELESELDALAAEGVLISVRPGRHRWEGL